MECTGCGHAFEDDEPCFEVARNDFYCTYCCLPTRAGEIPGPVQVELELISGGVHG